MEELVALLGTIVAVLSAITVGMVISEAGADCAKLATVCLLCIIPLVLVLGIAIVDIAETRTRKRSQLGLKNKYMKSNISTKQQIVCL